MTIEYEKIQKHLRSKQYTWLITGVAGFIGSNLLEKLLILNQKVIGLDNFETGYQYNIDQAINDAAQTLKIEKNHLITNNFKFIQGDIGELEKCYEACLNVDYVLHQAALGSVPRSIKDPIHTNKANIDGFLNMLVAAKDSKVKRFVYASSSSVYGDHPDLPKVENKVGNPLSPYSVSKIANELYAIVFAKTYNLKTVGLRYFNIFGKRQNPNGTYAAVIPKWISSIINQENVFINGDGKTSRDFCYIKNAVQINLLAALTKNQEAIDQIYNVALNEQTSLNQLYKMIEEKLRNTLKELTIKAPILRDTRVGDVRHSLADISKAQKLLYYQPIYKIEKGLDETVAWYVTSFSQNLKA
jgi:UDP-N-acetylglucosamine 4-epimerase